MKSCLTSTPFYFLVLIITSCMHSCCFSHLSLPLPFITVHTFRNRMILKTQLKLTPWPQTSAVSFQACVCSRGPSSRPVLLEAQSSLAFSTASLMGSVHTHRLLTSLLVRTLQSLCNQHRSPVRQPGLLPGTPDWPARDSQQKNLRTPRNESLSGH